MKPGHWDIRMGSWAGITEKDWIALRVLLGLLGVTTIARVDR